MKGDDKVERKLAAILHADVAGYSRLTSLDEVGTHKTLFAYLDEICELVQRNEGTVINITGDAVLADFVSAVAAVECAVQIQEHLKTRNADLPDDRKVIFRIGLNLGDVMVARNDIYGDGVNVAARLEGLADPGGICISGSIYEQVKNLLDLEFQSTGQHKVKNIAEPVQTYRIVLDPNGAGSPVRITDARHSGRAALVAGGVVLSAIAGAVLFWQGLPQVQQELSETHEVNQTKPSITVLPFSNISGNTEEKYFSDGLTEDIVTDLSRFRGLIVISSQGAVTNDDQALTVKDIGKKLGVKYVLKGSVQRLDKKIRVSAQLLDAVSGRNLWADRLVRDQTNLFELQDELVRNIVAKLAIKVDVAERERALEKHTDILEAYDYVLRGRDLCARATRTSNTEGKKFIHKAIELDKEYAPAYVALGWCQMDMLRFGWSGRPSETLQSTQELATRALNLDDENASAHRLLGTVYYKRQEHDIAIAEFNRALEINPNDADTLDGLGAVQLYAGQPDASIKAIETALRFNPNLGPSGLIHLGLAYYMKGQYADAIATFKRVLSRKSDLAILYVGLAASYAKLNQIEDAKSAAANVRRLSPFFKVEHFGNGFRNATDRAAIRDGLRIAGLK